jgi:hypothetical protein
MKRHRGQPLPLEKKLQIVGALLQQRKEREALMASRAAARSDARRHIRPSSRVAVRSLSLQYKFNYCFRRQQQEEQNSGSQSKRTTTNKRNNERQSKLCSTFCRDISRDGYSMWENHNRRSETWCVYLERYLLVIVSIFRSLINSFH